MSANVDRITAFFAAWDHGFDATIAAFEEHFADDARWEQSALPTTTSKSEAIGLMHGFRAQLGLEAIGVDLLHVAENDGVILTERVDHLKNAAGEVIVSFPVMGILELNADGRIQAWREFFDPRAALELLAAAPAT
jgi:limonene-1,2-epoxide hydrolase